MPEHYKWGDNCDGWHLLKSESLSVIKELMPPGTAEQLHCHRKAQQLFYILSGTATFELNGETTSIQKDQSFRIPPRSLHRILNNRQEDLSFILVSEPPGQADRITIVPYSGGLKEHVRKLNYEWLQKYFSVEPNDIIQLSDPENEIIAKGGHIFYAKYENEIVGTATLLKTENGIYELGKMAVTESAKGLGIGNTLMDYSILLAKQLGAKELILYSNRSLTPAITMYKKYSFVEVKMESGHYERANIKMKRVL
ncbi:MAG: GNAT family N-acetyltransferase [Bacteroidia bacterium]|jgi:mannose-6-phosphate isomerase-like protein (cupin superfamily)/predicted GNAT family N-acyltransferase